MKFQKIIILLVVATFSITACDTESKKKPEIKEVATPSPQKLAFTISGMTCEIGCAKTIQSKLSKKAGITAAKVIFSDSIALVEYNANTVSKEAITSFVNEIAGGIYSVKNAENVTAFNQEMK
jgi:copper chaperone CopZ